MNRLVVIVTSYAGSVVSFRGSLISELISSGSSVFVLAPDHSAGSRSSLISLGATPYDYPLNRVGFNPFGDLFSLFFLVLFFAKSKPFSVLTYFVKPNIWAIIASFIAGVPLRVSIVEGMGYAFTQSSSGRTLKQIISSWIIVVLYSISLRLASTVLVLNSDDQKLLMSSCRLNADKFVCLGGIGVCLDTWHMSPPHLVPFTFTMVGRLLKEKGVYEFLRAATIVKKYHPNSCFNLIGGIDSNPGSISLENISYWVDNHIVNYLGFVDVYPYLLETSVFVLPSYREGLPRSTQEALALGIPILTTDVPGCRDTVQNGVNGFLVEPFDHVSLANAMIYFIEHPEIVHQMGISSRALACSKFDHRRANSIILSQLYG